MSLTTSHPIWSSCGTNAFECQKAIITSRMLSGRYLTDKHQRHWTENKEGFCLLPACSYLKAEGDLEHLLLFCPSMESTRDSLLKMINRVCLEDENIAIILNNVFSDPDHKVRMQFLLDCTVLPEVIQLTQTQGPHIKNRLLYVARTWCYNVHRARMTQMGLLKFR